jgi:hypothetical protein
MASPRELEKQRRGVIPRRVRVVARPCCVRALNARTRVREQVRVTAREMRTGCVRGCPRAERTPPEGVLSPRARRTLFEGRVEPSSEADPARGGVETSSGADPARGSVYPSSEANLARGASAALYWRAAGTTRAVVVLCIRLGVRVDLCFAFFVGFKRATLGYLGDP